DWLYGSPEAIKVFADYSGLPEKVAQRVPGLFPRETLVPDRVVGVDLIMAEAVQAKVMPAPLTAQQGAELVQIPEAGKERDRQGQDMRKIVLVAAVGVFTPVLAWAESATVESGVKSQIASHVRYNSRCQSSPVRIRITAEPENGTVTSETKSIVVPAQSDRGIPQQTPCVGKTVDGVVVYYQSKP